jgi:protein TonB
MEKRKTKKADLERKRSVFFQIGLIVALSVVLAAFEWSKKISKTTTAYQIKGIELETEMIPVTRKKEVKPPLPKHYEKFEVVVDEEPLETEFEPFNSEAEEGDKIEFQIPDGIIEEPEDDSIYLISEKQPAPPGGMIGLRYYLAKNIKYPREAVANDVQGKVYVRFVVNKKGIIENVQVLRGVHPLLDKEALRVVKNMPKWKPGEQSGKPVSVWFVLPIVFVLR